MATVDGIVFAKIMKQWNPAANLALCQPNQGAEVDIGHPFFMVIFLIDKVFDFLNIAIAEQQQAMGF